MSSGGSKRRGFRQLAVVLVLACLGGSPGSAQQQPQPPAAQPLPPPARLEPRCTVVGEARGAVAQCEIGFLTDGVIRRANVVREENGAALETTWRPYALLQRSTSVLFLIDRSDARRARTVALATIDVERLVEALERSLPDGARLGVATISDRLSTVAPIGASRETLERSIRAVQAEGNPVSDRYRFVTNAIRQLAVSGGERRILVAALEARAGDRGASRDDAVRAARDGGVTIVTLGYSERTPDPADTAFLRKLAEDTGGIHLEAPRAGDRLSDEAVRRFALFAASGGMLTFPVPAGGNYRITAILDDGRTLVGRATLAIPAGVQPSPATPPAAAQPPTAQTPPGPVAQQPGQPGQPPTAQAPPARQPTGPALRPVTTPAPAAEVSYLERLWTSVTAAFSIVDPARIVADPVGWFWQSWAEQPYGLIAIGALLLILLLLILRLTIFRRRQPRIFGYVELDGVGRTPVTKPEIMIGRHSSNDVRIEDLSVHRHHAVLRRSRDSGRYIIADLERDPSRSNGVLVNGALTRETELGNGDVIELGKAKFRFFYA